jgi:hypothetical protein
MLVMGMKIFLWLVILIMPTWVNAQIDEGEQYIKLLRDGDWVQFMKEMENFERRGIENLDTNLYKKLNLVKANIDTFYGHLKIYFRRSDGTPFNEIVTIQNEKGRAVSLTVELHDKNKALPVQEYLGTDLYDIMKQGIVERLNRYQQEKIVLNQYDAQKKEFYYELPFLPYTEIREYPNPDEMYVFTFEECWRFRLPHFSKERQDTLYISIPKEWTVKEMIPSEWIKINFSGGIYSSDLSRLPGVINIKDLTSNTAVYYVPAEQFPDSLQGRVIQTNSLPDKGLIWRRMGILLALMLAIGGLTIW